MVFVMLTPTYTSFWLRAFALPSLCTVRVCDCQHNTYTFLVSMACERQDKQHFLFYIPLIRFWRGNFSRKDKNVLSLVVHMCLCEGARARVCAFYTILHFLSCRTDIFVRKIWSILVGLLFSGDQSHKPHPCTCAVYWTLNWAMWSMEIFIFARISCVSVGFLSLGIVTPFGRPQCKQTTKTPEHQQHLL